MISLLTQLKTQINADGTLLAAIGKYVQGQAAQNVDYPFLRGASVAASRTSGYGSSGIGAPQVQFSFFSNDDAGGGAVMQTIITRLESVVFPLLASVVSWRRLGEPMPDNSPQTRDKNAKAIWGWHVTYEFSTP